MKTVKRRSGWRRGDRLIYDQQLCRVVYASQVRREAGTGLWTTDPDKLPHQMIRAHIPMPVPLPCRGGIEQPTAAPDLSLAANVGDTAIPRRPSAADHIFES